MNYIVLLKRHDKWLPLEGYELASHRDATAHKEMMQQTFPNEVYALGTVYVQQAS